MLLKSVMVIMMLLVASIPSFGSATNTLGISVQFTHHHSHPEVHEHDHVYEDGNADLQDHKDGHDHDSKNHKHEIIISYLVSTYVQSKDVIVFWHFKLARFPMALDDELPLSFISGSIFRPPIAA